MSYNTCASFLHGIVTKGQNKLSSNKAIVTLVHPMSLLFLLACQLRRPYDSRLVYCTCRLKLTARPYCVRTYVHRFKHDSISNEKKDYFVAMTDFLASTTSNALNVYQGMCVSVHIIERTSKKLRVEEIEES